MKAENRRCRIVSVNFWLSSGLEIGLNEFAANCLLVPFSVTKYTEENPSELIHLSISYFFRSTRKFSKSPRSEI